MNRSELPDTLLGTLGMNPVHLAPDRVVIEMEIGPAVHQPMGILHGGASAALAETAASLGAYLGCRPEREYAVGIELNISHLRARSEGKLTATAVPIRKGRSVHVWGVDLVAEDGKKVAVARCTLAIRRIETGAAGAKDQDKES